MTKLLVLGGRFAGLTAAYTAKRLLGDKIDVTLINKTPYAAFRPGMPHVSIGVFKAEDLEVDLATALPAKGIKFILGEATAIDAKKNKVEYATPDGKKEKSDMISEMSVKKGFATARETHGYVICGWS